MYGKSFGHFIKHEPLWLTVYSGHELTQFPFKQYEYSGLQNILGHSNSFTKGFIQYFINPLSIWVVNWGHSFKQACWNMYWFTGQLLVQLVIVWDHCLERTDNSVGKHLVSISYKKICSFNIYIPFFLIKSLYKGKRKCSNFNGRLFGIVISK